jgi:hypothetical protein
MFGDEPQPKLARETTTLAAFVFGPCGSKPVQFQVFQNIWFQVFLGDLGQIFGRDALIGIDVGTVEEKNWAPTCFHMVIPLWKVKCCQPRVHRETQRKSKKINIIIEVWVTRNSL